MESQFNLADSSRVPVWFEVPDVDSRLEYRVELRYYSLPWGSRASIAMIDSDGRLVDRLKLQVEEIDVTQDSQCPRYQVLRGEGVVDIVEHRTMEPIFYMTDG